jgi:hypothetical protein
MTAGSLPVTGALLVLLQLLPLGAVAQQANGIPDGSALGGEVAHLWVNDNPNTELTLIAFRLSTLRQRRLGFDLEAALATGDGLSGFDLTLGSIYHLPLAGVGLLFGAGVNALAAGGGDDAGGALGLQLGGSVLLPVSGGSGFRFDVAWRRYFTGGDGFNAVMVGLGYTSLPHWH